MAHCRHHSFYHTDCNDCKKAQDRAATEDDSSSVITTMEIEGGIALVEALVDSSTTTTDTSSDATGFSGFDGGDTGGGGSDGNW